MAARKWEWWAFGAAAVVVACLVAFGPKREPDPERVALETCVQAIKLSSRNSETARVPAEVNVSETPDEFAFAWPRGQGLQLQNGFGAMLDAQATCLTDSTGKILSLTIDGKPIIE